MRHFFAERGWPFFGGCPPDTRGGCTWNTPQGGVAILVREGLTAELAKLARKREVDPLVWGLWHSTRLVHVWVTLGDGGTVPHAVLVYNMVGDCESNAALWEDVLHHLSGLGNAPYVVGADCVFPLGRLRDVPHAMLVHLLTHRLVDSDLEYAGFEEHYQCGYTWGEEVVATRIDGVLAEPRTASTITRVERTPSEGIPGHRPVCFTLRLRRRVRRCSGPCPPPPPVLPPERDPDVQYVVGEELLFPYHGKWDSLLAARRVDEPLEFLTCAAAESLLALSQAAPTDPSQVDRVTPLLRAPVGLQCGRGTWQLLKHINVCLHQCRVTGALEMAPLVCLQATLEALRTVNRGSQNEPRGPRVLPVGEECS